MGMNINSLWLKRSKEKKSMTNISMFFFLSCRQPDAQAASLKPNQLRQSCYEIMLVLLNNSCFERISLSFSLDCNGKVAVVPQEMEDRWMWQVAGTRTFSTFLFLSQ